MGVEVGPVELAGPFIGFTGKRISKIGYDTFEPVIDYCWCRSRPILPFLLSSADSNNVLTVT